MAEKLKKTLTNELKAYRRQGVELMLSRGIKEAANRVNQKAKTAKKQKEKEEAAKAEAEKKENEEKPNEVNAE